MKPLRPMGDVPAAGTETVDFFGRRALVYRHRGEVTAALSVCSTWALELEDGQPAAPESKALVPSTRIDDGVLTDVRSE